MVFVLIFYFPLGQIYLKNIKYDKSFYWINKGHNSHFNFGTERLDITHVWQIMVQAIYNSNQRITLSDATLW